MAPQKIDQGTIIIIDVGNNTSASDEKNRKSFFEKAKECASCITERKIISQGKNFLGIILLGSNNTKNSMAEQCKGTFRHIEMLSELNFPTWKMIRDMPDKPSQKKGDWIEGLIVAAEHFKSQSGVKIVDKKIILMTNFQSPTSFTYKEVKGILEGFEEDKFEVDIIGPNLYDDNLKGEDIEMAKQFVESTNGATADFEYTMQYLSFHKKRAIHSMPWNVDLCIGPSIRIPVSSFIRLRDEPIVKNWHKAIKDPVTSTASTTEGVVKIKEYVNTESQNVVEASEKIDGVHYGQSIIPLSESDKSMLYMSGEKTLSVYGFTEYNKVDWQCLNGDGLSYVFGRKGDKKAQQAIKCLVECLYELNLVGIVRRVYNKNSAPKMYALFPVIDTNNYVCLSMAALCFKEDIKYMSFPSTDFKKYACTDQQVNAFKDLIKAMDLTKAYDETYDDTEAFPIATTVSPFAQYVLDCIAFRAMNPGKPLPQPRDNIMSLFNVPPEIEKRACEPLDKLKSLFVLNKVEKKQRKKKGDLMDIAQFDTTVEPTADRSKLQDIPDIQLPDEFPNSEIEKIGTLDPITDFTKLKSKSKNLADLTPEMTSAIETLVYSNLDGCYRKAFDVMQFFRKECVEGDPSHYNRWLQKFKVALNDRNKTDVLDLINERNVNYILMSENNLSTYETVESHDDTQMYENNTMPISGDLTIQTQVNDLYDDF